MKKVEKSRNYSFIKKGGIILQEREELVLNPVPKEERVGWLAPLFNMLGSNIAISELMVGEL